MSAAIILGIMLIGACNTLPLMSNDETRANQCLKAHMLPKRLADGRIVCIKP